MPPNLDDISAAMPISEFDIIERYFKFGSAQRPDVVLGVGDDAALLAVPPGWQLAVTTDTLVADVHFPRLAPADSIGHKALAVNLSDLAAMGANPAWATLALTLDRVSPEWLESYARGFMQLACSAGVALVGGDLTQGPLSMTVQAMGLVPPGEALRRDGARPGDLIYVSGHLGDAALGLRLYREPAQAENMNHDYLLSRLHRPTPRIALGSALRGIASAAIDVSDGLLADLWHICERSQVGASVWVDQLPRSQAFLNVAGLKETLDLPLSGGDDYELCFTVPRHHQAVLAGIAELAGCQLTAIGEVSAHPGLHCRYDDGRAYQPANLGYQHFSGNKPS